VGQRPDKSAKSTPSWPKWSWEMSRIHAMTSAAVILPVLVKHWEIRPGQNVFCEVGK